MPPETPAKDRADRIVEDATRRLVTELEAGRSDALREYLAAMGRFHRYSWTNTVLIQSQRPTATRVAGYHTWRDFGRSVRRGEKGIVIYAPVVARNERARPMLLPGERPPKEREVVGQAKRGNWGSWKQLPSGFPSRSHRTGLLGTTGGKSGLSAVGQSSLNSMVANFRAWVATNVTAALRSLTLAAMSR
jgi:hypothetical protein